MTHASHLHPTSVALACAVLLAGSATAETADSPAARFAAKQFGGLAKLTSVPSQDGGEPVVQQAQVGDRVVGWVFRTDNLKPFVKGRVDQIGTLVALGADGKIKAIEVVKHREDKPWFDRLKRPFYKQFEGLAADGSDKRPDTVATATLSSKAIVDDVLAACAEVVALPQVKAVLSPTTEAPATQPTPHVGEPAGDKDVVASEPPGTL
jgi:hypothetical protein